MCVFSLGLPVRKFKREWGEWKERKRGEREIERERKRENITCFCSSEFILFLGINIED